MLSQLIDYLSNKTLTLWGYGIDTKSIHIFIQNYCQNTIIHIVDSNTSKEDRLEIFANSDMIIKSPGISLHNHSLRANDYAFTSSSEIFLKFFGVQTIGITGSKGKSTTAKLICDFLSSVGKSTILAGNIGIPFFDIVSSIKDEDIIVAELSSHQLEVMHYSPHIAILLNLFAEHLDYYRDEAHYFDSKLNILLHQKPNDISITLANPQYPIEHALKAKNQYKIEDYAFDNDILVHSHTLGVLAVICELYQIPFGVLIKFLPTFDTLEHRLEFVLEHRGVKYYNDSISTIPQSCIAGIEALGNVHTLILGGKDRGIDYDHLCRYIELDTQIQNIMLFDQTGKILLGKIDKSKFKNIQYETTLELLFAHIAKIKTKGTVLFSPAASSYNQFRNYQERGDLFKYLCSEKFK